MSQNSNGIYFECRVGAQHDGYRPGACASGTQTLSFAKHSVLAVVPARGGSKGIARKNLATVGPLSLIGWAAKTVIKLPWIDCAIVSTDDDEMAEEALRHGLDVPFMRPPGLSSDTASAIDMWRHAWLESEVHFRRRFDLSVLLQPTTPLRRAEDVERTVREMLDGGHDAAATVSAVPGHFVPEKCLRVIADGTLAFYHVAGGTFTSRQLAADYYARNGVCYAATRTSVVTNGTIVESNCKAVVIDGHVVNIDEPIELEMAEFFYQRGRSARLRAPRVERA